LELTNGQYTITDDKHRVDIDFIVDALDTTYWAKGRKREIIEQSIRNSELLSVFNTGKQIGFARIVSDYATFAWICDVYLVPDERGKGLGRWLMACIQEHPSTQVGLQLLATRDAHWLYEKFGFQRRECMYKRR
jgi:GNAT superfamily N-acetyltransferase